jgi:hypothetical protein
MNKRLAKLKNIQEANIAFLNRNTKESLNEGRFDDDDDYDDYDDDPRDYRDDDDYDDFADPGGNSALRASSYDNPREYPCPTCGAEDVLTLKDVNLGYQCDRCADNAERGGY